jgi:hypothetical protein
LEILRDCIGDSIAVLQKYPAGYFCNTAIESPIRSLGSSNDFVIKFLSQVGNFTGFSIDSNIFYRSIQWSE